MTESNTVWQRIETNLNRAAQEAYERDINKRGEAPNTGRLVEYQRAVQEQFADWIVVLYLSGHVNG